MKKQKTMRLEVAFNKSRIHGKYKDTHSRGFFSVVAILTMLWVASMPMNKDILQIYAPTDICQQSPPLKEKKKDKIGAQYWPIETIGTTHGEKSQRGNHRSQISMKPRTAYQLAIQTAVK